MPRLDLARTIRSLLPAGPSLLLFATCFDPGQPRSPANEAGDTEEECPIGDRRCPCFPNGTCNEDLVCLSDVCVADDREDESTGPMDASDTTTGYDGSTTSGRVTTSADAGTTNTTGTTSGTSGGSAEEPRCTPAATEVCAHETCSGVRACMDDGTWGPCVCVPAPLCISGAFQCNGEQPQRCDDEGQAWVDEGPPCRTGEGCNARAETCVTGILEPFNGWIYGRDNALGVQGELSVGGAGLDSTEADWDVSMCMRGTSGNIPSYAPVGSIAFCQTEPIDDPPSKMYSLGDCPYPRVRELRGVRITIGGGEIPAPLRLYFGERGHSTSSSASVEIGPGTHEVLMEDARGPYGEPPVYDDIVGITLRVPEESTFSVCISELTLLW